MLRDTYAKLTPWQKTQVARHPERPHFKDYVAALIEDFVPLAGDRAFGEDEAIVGGLGRLGGRKVMLIGHEKGDDTASRLNHNFGMARPEGYRKAIRLMQLADRFGLPVVTLVDTPGAFPGRPGRGARPGRGDRPLDRAMPRARRADGRGDRRGRGLGRRDRDRRRQPGADARAQRLFGDLARRLRLDPVAHRRKGGRRGRGDADHRRRSQAAGRDRSDRRPSRRAARTAIRPLAIATLGEEIAEELSELTTLSPAQLRKQRRDKYLCDRLSKGKGRRDFAPPPSSETSSNARRLSLHRSEATLLKVDSGWCRGPAWR